VLVKNASELKTAWEESYSHRDNFLFYPNEEIIRFIAKYVRKQLDLNEYQDRKSFSNRPPRLLDLGCGIGRHVIYGHALGCEVYGLDLSSTAVQFAKRWAATVNIPDINERVLAGDVTRLPWQEGFFDIVVSHGVLDSMPILTAQAAVREVSRVLTGDGLFYCDLIASRESLSSNSVPGQVLLTSSQEQGTVQSYFNRQKLDDLMTPHFTLTDLALVHRHDLLNDQSDFRYHIVMKPKQ
jgi:SAM-dependent methyltransferase